MDTRNEERADREIALEKIKAIELAKDKHYIIFIPMSTRLPLESIEWMQQDLSQDGYDNIMFVQVKSTEGIKVVEHDKRYRITEEDKRGEDKKA